MKENVIHEKTEKFAIRIVNLYKYLCSEQKEYVLSNIMSNLEFGMWNLELVPDFAFAIQG